MKFGNSSHGQLSDRLGSRNPGEHGRRRRRRREGTTYQCCRDGPNEGCSDCPTSKYHYCKTIFRNYTTNETPEIEIHCYGNTDKKEECEHEYIKKWKDVGDDELIGCCNKTFCNTSSIANWEDNTTFTVGKSDAAPKTRGKTIETISGIAAAVFVILLLVVTLFAYMVRRKKNERKINMKATQEKNLRELRNLLSSGSVVSTTPAAPNAEQDNLRQKLNSALKTDSLELHFPLSHGSFSDVWKAKLSSDTVVAKMFPKKHEALWQHEQDIYLIPHMQNANCLPQLLAIDRRKISTTGDKDDEEKQLILVLELMALGSLRERLKSTVTWIELLKISRGLLSALSHLHSSIPDPVNRKPPIAHRNITSAHVLLKPDLTVCLCDMTNALPLKANSCRNNSQVGSIRYSAPEILEGAISLKLESFLTIDMYATAFVLWELLSRCSAFKDHLEEYELPLQQELGSHPSMLLAVEVVSRKRLRPKLHRSWNLTPGGKDFSRAMRDCWDHESEARLTAACTLNRLQELKYDHNEDIDAFPVLAGNSIPANRSSYVVRESGDGGCQSCSEEFSMA